MTQLNTESDIHATLAALPVIDDEQRNAVVCALIGHSRIINSFLGYINCARCGAQIGDTLGGSFDASKHVVVGHNCPTCHENAASLTWRDTLFAPDPFTEEPAQ